MASVSKLANPDFARAVAEAYAKGMSTEDMADLFNVHKDTIRSWNRDPRVQAIAGKLTYERVLRITRKLDSRMEEIIEDLVEQDEPDPELILKIRKEYLSRSGTTETPGYTPEQTESTVKALEENPGLADALKELLKAEK
jgi:transposase